MLLYFFKIKIMCFESNPPYIFSHMVFYIFTSAHGCKQGKTSD